MASAFTHHPPELGVPTLFELSSDTKVFYPHLVTRLANNTVLLVPIDVRYGVPAVNTSDDIPHFVQHPSPFEDDGTVSMACRTLLIATLQEDVRQTKLKKQRCLVWSPSSCSYVEIDGSTCEVTDGPAMTVGAAFNAARRAVIRSKYPQIHVEEPSGVFGTICPAHATKEDLVAQAIGIVMNSGYRVRVVWSESETINAELTDKFGAKSEQIRPCAIWSECAALDGNFGKAACDTKLNLESPHILVYGRYTFVLVYPDTLTKEELVAKGSDLLHLFPRVCVVFSSTESIWPKPRQLDVVW